MKSLKYIVLFAALLGFTQNESLAQVCYGGGSYQTNGDEIPCGEDPMAPCCQVYNACNGPAFGCQNYDPDYSATSGCDLSCAPIDNGVLFLLLGGGLFGGFMIKRRRESELLPISAK